MRELCCRWQGPSRSCGANEIVAKRLSVRETERLVARKGQGGAATAKRSQVSEKSRDILRIEEQLADRLTAPVEIRLQTPRP